MSSGIMATDTTYPLSSAVQVEALHGILGADNPSDAYAVMNISKTPGTGASYKLQQLIRDGVSTQWVDVKNAAFSGNGAAATGQVVARISGQAVRILAVNGTTPGTGANTPAFRLSVHYDKGHQVRNQIGY